MLDFPRSLLAFQRRFRDEAACAAYLAALRCSDGFRCPGCGHNQAWMLDTNAWALGVYHGLRPKHLQSYLDEFTYRFNRRRTCLAAFRSLLGIAARRQPVNYKMLIAAEAAG
jgi:hypothetical protein